MLREEYEESLLFGKARRAVKKCEKIFDFTLKVLLFMRFTSRVLRGALTSNFFRLFFWTPATDYVKSEELLVILMSTMSVCVVVYTFYATLPSLWKQGNTLCSVRENSVLYYPAWVITENFDTSFSEFVNIK